MYALAIKIVKLALQATVAIYAAIAKGIAFIVRAPFKSAEKKREEKRCERDGAERAASIQAALDEAGIRASYRGEVSKGETQGAVSGHEHRAQCDGRNPYTRER